MDITKARKVIELEKEGRKILVTLYEGGQVSSCVEEETRRYCETCLCNDELCQEWIESLKQKGYEATEIELGELEIDESLPKFLQERETTVPTEVERKVEAEPEVSEDAISPADQEVS